MTRTSVSYKVRKGQFLDITTSMFKESYSRMLYWRPRIWSTAGMVQPFVLAPNSLLYNVEKFTFYVNDEE